MGYDELISREDAVDRVLECRDRIQSEPSISVPVSDIVGRRIAEPVIASEDHPPASHATMDGFAFDANDTYPLSIVDEVFPEDEPPSIDPGEAVRIATGAPLPFGANAVLKREDAEIRDGRLTGDSVPPGTYTYQRGSNVSAGERLFDPGERLTARDAILLRDLGYDAVPVYPPHSVGILATGTEIHTGESRDLDSPMLAGLVRSWGHEPILEGTVPDEYEGVRDRIDELAHQHDIVLTTGGTSVGRKDYVVRALEELGDVAFHGVRVRPGKPVAVATLPEHDAVAVAIPGKPIGAYIITISVVRPLFADHSRVPSTEAGLARDIDIPRSGFEYWIPVTLEDIPAGGTELTAMPLGHADSALPIYQDTFSPSVLSSSTRASRADGVVITDTALSARETVAVHPLDAFER